MNKISEYFESLAAKYLGHSDCSCHYSDASVFSARVPRILQYPCMGVDTDGFSISGLPGNEFMTIQYNIYILSHIRDTGAATELNNAFVSSHNILMKMIREMNEAVASNRDCMGRYFDISTVEATRIEFKDAALFGYAMSFAMRIPLDLYLCQLQ